MSRDTFAECQHLKVIYATEDYDPGLFYASLPPPTIVGPPPNTAVQGISVWDLRDLRDVVIPEGTEKIGGYWFWGRLFKSVEIPASVTEIGTCAFHGCKWL